MKRALAKCVIRGTASKTNEISILLDDPHAAQFPGGPELRLAMCKGARRRIWAVTLHVLVAQTHLVRETLAADVADLTATKANHSPCLWFKKARNSVWGCTHVGVDRLTHEISHLHID